MRKIITTFLSTISTVFRLTIPPFPENMRCACSIIVFLRLRSSRSQSQTLVLSTIVTVTRLQGSSLDMSITRALQTTSIQVNVANTTISFSQNF